MNRLKSFQKTFGLVGPTLFRSLAEFQKCQRGEVRHGILRKIQSPEYVIDLYISFDISLRLLLLLLDSCCNANNNRTTVT